MWKEVAQEPFLSSEDYPQEMSWDPKFHSDTMLNNGWQGPFEVHNF